MSFDQFRIAVERPDGVHYYRLNTKDATLSGGKKQSLLYFVREDGVQLPAAYVVVESARGHLPLEGQIIVAQEMVRRLGVDPDKAAQVTGGLKADYEGLGNRQRKQVIGQIREALDDEQ